MYRFWLIDKMRNGVFILFFFVCSLNCFPSGDITSLNDFYNEDSGLILLIPNIENTDYSLNAIQQESEDKQIKQLVLSFNYIQNKEVCFNNFFRNVFVITQYYNHLLNNQIDLPPPSNV